jgi:predicted aminopeptidase
VTSSSSARRLAVALLLGLALACAPGCYTAHVVVGELGILAGRQPIEEVLATRTLAKDDRAKLQLVLDVRRFAIEQLGLRDTGSFRTVYDTGGKPIAWNVSASDPDSFAPYTWDFPVVGRMPYIGYFDEARADDEAAGLRAKGLDALVLPVPAYSTLGWFEDPFFSSMLKYDESEIADIIIHEMAHATVFIDSDAEFNETLATFIGQRGAQAFFLARGGPGDPALAAARDDERQSDLFTRELTRLRDALGRVYATSAPRAEKLRAKAAAIAAWRDHFRTVVQPQLTGGAYSWVLDDDQVEFNNAFLLAFERYHGELDLFDALWEDEGQDLPATIQALVALADEEDPRAALEQRVADDRRLLGVVPRR